MSRKVSRKALLVCIVALFISLMVCQVGLPATASTPITLYGTVTASGGFQGFSANYTAPPTLVWSVEGVGPTINAKVTSITKDGFNWIMSDYNVHTFHWIAIGT